MPGLRLRDCRRSQHLRVRRGGCAARGGGARTRRPGGEAGHHPRLYGRGPRRYCRPSWGPGMSAPPVVGHLDSWPRFAPNRPVRNEDDLSPGRPPASTTSKPGASRTGDCFPTGSSSAPNPVPPASIRCGDWALATLTSSATSPGPAGTTSARPASAGSASPARTASTHTAYDGRALVVVRPTGPGGITVHVSAPECEPVTVNPRARAMTWASGPGSAERGRQVPVQ